MSRQLTKNEYEMLMNIKANIHTILVNVDSLLTDGVEDGFDCIEDFETVDEEIKSLLSDLRW